MNVEPVAYFHSAFTTKFGIPRQSGIVNELRGTIVLEPKYRSAEAVRGLSGFDYLWLIWGFSANGNAWKATVRPPLLGGNVAMGVFATRSPFRPNGLGLSSVRIESIEKTETDGIVINVLGADLMDGTPIYDIKPYVAYSDAHPAARGGFVDENVWQTLQVSVPAELRQLFSQQDYEALLRVLEQDPRPQYHDAPDRVYGMPYSGYDIRFVVSRERVLTVIDAVPIEK